ncbi:MAG TPA: hypothetical protein VIT85_08050 [Solirubrobacterales bacterium]
MAIGLSIRFADGTAEQYEAVHEQMGVESDPPEGMIFHAAGPIDGGWGVLDFWESRAQFDAFLEGRIGPAMAALGDAALPNPEIKEFPVHNYMRP